jgi:PAS domain S-box-containing protein
MRTVRTALGGSLPACVCALVFVRPLAAADAPKLVVAIYPNESDRAPGLIAADHAIRTAFEQSPIPIQVRNEYVDTARLTDPEFCRAQVAFLRQKYAGRKADLVMAGLSSGLDFVLAHRDELFPGVPVVHIAVDGREADARRLPPDVTGSPIRMDLDGTLGLALRLHPDTRRVFVVAGRAAFDAYWEGEARRAFARHEPRVEFEYLAGRPMDELLDRVAALPEHSLVYYLHVFEDGAGRTYVPAEALELITTRANAPIYGHVGTYVGRGIVGGCVFDFEAEGRKAARLALHVLGGGSPSRPPPSVRDDNAMVFDGRQLRRWGIAESDLPAGSVVRFRETSAWDAYRWPILGAAGFVTIETLLVTGLLVERVRRRRAEGRFRQVIDTAPVGILAVARDGTIAIANPHAERVFGYDPGELMGLPVERLMPAGYRDRHAADRDRFFAAPAVRVMGHGRDLHAVRKDGTEIPVEIGLSPLATPRGLYALASVIDLTARWRAEDGLRASQAELRRLAGRLLEAQEAERRRIARELHDDVNQSLAMLAVDLDLLGQAGPAVAAQTGALATRVREVSSAVHGLSHALHPSRLEHLGLVPALRGLCKELTGRHGLEVKFTHFDVPEAVPGAAALCLYRIAQEALRNVVKHARTAHAAVELSGTPDGLRLRVTDDGRGFDPRSADGGLGLVSMRERLLTVGGTLAVDARPGGGTRIEARVPPPGGEPPGVGR